MLYIPLVPIIGSGSPYLVHPGPPGAMPIIHVFYSPYYSFIILTNSSPIIHIAYQRCLYVASLARQHCEELSYVSGSLRWHNLRSGYREEAGSLASKNRSSLESAWCLSCGLAAAFL